MPDAHRIDAHHIDVYVGLGSNLDADRRLRAAAEALEAEFGPLRRSAVYRSPAVGWPAPDYLNAAVAFATTLPPEEVKTRLVALEDVARRSRSQPPHPMCPLDLDLLLYGRRVNAQQRLPHADVLSRAHVLAPLADIAPDLVHPLTGERIEHAWAARGHGVELTKVGPLGGP
ncbi:MAG TPA: 2-amino-4-hydroxy-6-hydroxymethyldihydropteridine diphosphokinase [Gammaproteobacteria bacterium]|nr:2-amino-4-hydroxy-6-hydroxymethyldihydropteridine diphosphokinase [Gammaproteobacteria bacterium]